MSQGRSRRIRLIFGIAAAATLGALAASAEGAVKVSKYRITEIKQTSTLRSTIVDDNGRASGNLTTQWRWRGNKPLDIELSTKSKRIGLRTGAVSGLRAQQFEMRGTVNAAATPDASSLKSGTCNFGKVREIKRGRLINISAFPPTLVNGKVVLSLAGPAPNDLIARLGNDSQHPCFKIARMAGPIDRTQAGIGGITQRWTGSQRELRRKFAGKRKRVIWKETRNLPVRGTTPSARVSGRLKQATTAKLILVGSR